MKAASGELSKRELALIEVAVRAALRRQLAFVLSAMRTETVRRRVLSALAVAAITEKGGSALDIGAEDFKTADEQIRFWNLSHPPEQQI